MADQNNQGQFGNRSDTRQQASKGGKSQGKENNRGNFANRDDVAEVARKGGQSRGQNSNTDTTDEMDGE